MQSKSLLPWGWGVQPLARTSLPLLLLLPPRSSAELVAVARGASFAAWLSSAVWGHPRAQGWAEWVAWARAELVLAESPALECQSLGPRRGRE